MNRDGLLWFVWIDRRFRNVKKIGSVIGPAFRVSREEDE